MEAAPALQAMWSAWAQVVPDGHSRGQGCLKPCDVRSGREGASPVCSGPSAAVCGPVLAGERGRSWRPWPGLPQHTASQAASISPQWTWLSALKSEPLCASLQNAHASCSPPRVGPSWPPCPWGEGLPQGSSSGALGGRRGWSELALCPLPIRTAASLSRGAVAGSHDSWEDPGAPHRERAGGTAALTGN